MLKPVTGLLIFIFTIADVQACDMTAESFAGKMNFYSSDAHVKGSATEKAIRLVHSAHLTNDMKMHIRGATGTIAGDLQYVLNWFPNSPEALDLVSRLDQAIKKGRKPRAAAMHSTVDCYFQRALVINDQQPETYFIWGLHHIRSGHYREAKLKFESAKVLGARGSNFNYHYGLLHMKAGEYEEALKYGKLAYAQGFPLPGLRKMLEAKGYSLEE